MDWTMGWISLGLISVIVVMLVLYGIYAYYINDAEAPRNREVVGRPAADKSFRALVEEVFPAGNNKIFVCFTVTTGQIEVGELVCVERTPTNPVPVITIEHSRQSHERACQGQSSAIVTDHSLAEGGLKRGDFLIAAPVEDPDCDATRLADKS